MLHYSALGLLTVSMTLWTHLRQFALFNTHNIAFLRG